MSERWCVKRKHYGGGESVISIHDSEDEAKLVASSLNTQYQAGNYYVEKWRDND